MNCRIIVFRRTGCHVPVPVLSARSTISNYQQSLHGLQNRLPINSFHQDDGDDFCYLEADNDNYPLPPHVSESSRKRGASDSRRGPIKVHIQFDI